jgi:hypothetical protein
MLHNIFGGKRPVSKPKSRWNEAVEKDSKKMPGIIISDTETMRRQEWAKVRYGHVAPQKKKKKNNNNNKICSLESKSKCDNVTANYKVPLMHCGSLCN